MSLQDTYKDLDTNNFYEFHQSNLSVNALQLIDSSENSQDSNST